MNKNHKKLKRIIDIVRKHWESNIKKNNCKVYKEI